MKRINTLLAAAIAIAIGSLLCACSAEDDMVSRTDYGKLRLGRMDLSGAVSLALKKTGPTRVIDGEFLSAGLYKIDADGNITAVGVYFTTDTLGNKLEHEEALRVKPREIYSLTDNYMLAVECLYYDTDGDNVADKWDETGARWIEQIVPYKNLLVRLSDGKIWCVDRIKERLIGYAYGYWLKGNFEEDRYGNLYHADSRNVYKFNLDKDDPSYEQIVSEAPYPFNNSYGGFFKIADNGVVWSWDRAREAFTLNSDVVFAWPHSGFQSITAEDLMQEAYPDEKISVELPEYILDRTWGHPKYHRMVHDDDNNRSESGLFVVAGRPALICGNPFKIESSENGKRYSGFAGIDWFDESYRTLIYERMKEYDNARFYWFTIGDTPGSVKLEKPITLTGMPQAAMEAMSSVRFGGYGCVIRSVFEGDGYLLTSDCCDSSCITRLDLRTREWKYLTQCDFKVQFDAVARESFAYDNKVWTIDTDSGHFGAHWFDLHNYETGFVPFNVVLPDYMSRSDWRHKDGKITYYDRNPADGKYTTIVIDLMTGEVIQSENNDPNMFFETLINLN